jgi:TrmH RNA methyltransferase
MITTSRRLCCPHHLLRRTLSTGVGRDELKICGLAAVKARFARDSDSVQRLFFDEPTSRKVASATRIMAQEKKVYRCVPTAELQKIAGSVHHGGIVAVAKIRALSSPTPADIHEWALARLPVLLLDRISNVHNLGAIARTAAHFGVAHIVLADANFNPGAARPTEAAHRVAEGGMEHVALWHVAKVDAFAKGLAGAGYDVIGAATRGGRPEVMAHGGGHEDACTRGAAEPPARAVALVMGNEEQGMAPAVAAACTRLVTIPGTGHVESLNVSVAASILLWECCGRQSESEPRRS